MILMEIPIKLTGVLVYTTITGSIALVFWHLLGCLLEKYGYSRWYYVGLRVVTCLFLIPVTYIVAFGMNVITSRWQGMLFVKTPLILVVCQIISGTWILGMGVVASKYAFNAMCLYRRNKSSFSCEKGKQQLFDSICTELKIPVGRIQLRQNYEVITAEFMGIFCPQVVLPVREFSKEELRTIFIHELVHYQQKDIHLKCLVMLVLVFHYFNPMAWLLSKTVYKWSEYACDERACNMVGGLTVYFKNILSIAESTWQKKFHLTAHLMEHKNELEERIQHMKKVQKIKRKSILLATLLSFLLFISSSTTVLAAIDGLSRQYLNWVESTDTLIEVKATAEESLCMVYTDNGPEEGIVVENGEIEQRTKNMSYLEWTVLASSMKQTGIFYASKGQVIKVYIFQNSHTDKELMVGIIAPSGDRTYVRGKDEISQDFNVNTSGYYRVFVQNKNSVSIDVEGSYTVR